MENSQEIMEIIKNTVQATSDFTSEQAPLYVKEVLEWGVFANLMQGIIALIACIFFLWLANICRKKYDEHGMCSMFDVGGIICVILSVVISIISIAGFTCSLKAKIAPRAYLVGKIIPHID